MKRQQEFGKYFRERTLTIHIKMYTCQLSHAVRDDML